MIYASRLEWIEATDPDENDQLVFEGEGGTRIVELDIPHGLMRDFINAHAASYTWVHLDGTVRTDSDEMPMGSEPIIAIDAMIERDVGDDMLEDEPHAMTELQAFQKRLQRSLDLVAAAITRLQSRQP